MENLSTRFDTLQEVLLAHYEKDSKKITDHVSFWELLRRESVMLHYARQQGISSLGFFQVPSLQVSEAKAKKAIMMSLMLQQLAKTPFGQEPWSMTETSLEMLEAPPKGKFKKGPRTVEVWFDNNPDNSFPYTSWTCIYIQDAEDTWHKVEGLVDYEGLYYVDCDGEVHYYVKFAADALQYATTGMWRVNYKNQTISASVSSSSSEDQQRQGQQQQQQQQQPSTTTSVEWPQRPSSSGLQHESPFTPRGHGRGCVRGRRSSGSSPHQRGDRGGRGRSQSPSTPTTPGALPPDLSFAGGDRSGGGGGGGGGGRQRGRRGSRGPPRLSPYIPLGQVEQGPGRPEGAALQRPGRPEKNPRLSSTTPVVVLKGPGNALKCWRLRAKAKHGALFCAISTAFSWVEKSSSSRIGRHRILVGFINEEQREDFLRTVRLPRGVECVPGGLDSL
ncbi:putative E2 protein [Felis catus papillomavirus 4]|uniref:Regulatory protein E2 n=1 Tax=Felis catus papillomavirus 4 TaxID=1398507 RepID=T2D2Z1_9PAPI|nr:putative E2 protein [Felis catus papillomavirus 4]AGV40805.1 putative E2 protein [Felis catus papillomavirus 4]BCW91359.1 E2 protein [Felis catus papillomavirus 4]